jgi:hypothetical protein
MRTLIFMSFLSASIGHSQIDTLEFDNEIDASNHIFALLDSTIYGPSLLNRNLSIDSTIIDQLNGDYSRITGLLNWASVFNTVSLSYTDHSVMPSIPDFAFDISNYFSQLELENEEMLIQPFSLILHQSSYIDSLMLADSTDADEDGHLLPLIDEVDFYQKTMLKSAAILEFYPHSGYDEGNLIYNADYVFTSPNISVLELEINLGDSMGFQPFGIANPILTYNRLVDSTLAIARVTYLMDSDTLIDSLSFYLTTVSYPDATVQPKSGEDDDDEEGYDEWHYIWHYDPIEGNGLKFTIGVKIGCGNTLGIRRPIIIVAPYRPVVQPFSMHKYWEQFNIGGIYDLWHQLGYDLLYVKEKPGNKSLEEVGTELMVLVDSVNRIKKENYPNEDWETILMGYSMGGQVVRYGLLKSEKQHMEAGRVHHHTRQYIAFDSPHHGASIPMSSQAVYDSFRFSNLIAAIAYGSLVDEASSDMGYYSINASEELLVDNEYNPHPHFAAIGYQLSVNNAFNHFYTPIGDLRKSFPSFTRNVGISMGSYINDYEMEWGLTPEMLMFKQNTPIVGLGTLGWANRDYYSSKYSTTEAKTVFERYDVILYVVFVYSVNNKYKFKNNFEWDMGQGGYKTLFYDGEAGGANTILRTSTLGVGTKYYKEQVMFMPLVSALAINPTIWADNNLYYNLLENELFIIDRNDLGVPIETDNYGYPHLGHPTNHFEITPFEAVYADQFSYDHIVMKKTVYDYEAIGQIDLGRLREFMLNEVEPWNFPLQNKVIGENHVIDPAYEYKAWYKARGAILIGNSVTPRTNSGDYIIQATGNITVYAGAAVDIKPGFHAKAGSTFHAFIEPYTPCEVMGESTPNSNGNEGAYTNLAKEQAPQSLDEVNENESVFLFPNPNQGNFTFSTTSGNPLGTLYVYTLTGQLVHQEVITSSNTVLNLNLTKGLYILTFENNEKLTSLKMIIQ